MKLLAKTILVVFIGIILFGFVPMGHNTHQNNGEMESLCPIAELFSVSSCLPDTASMAVVHLDAFHSFLNTIYGSFFFKIGLLFAACSLLISLGNKLGRFALLSPYSFLFPVKRKVSYSRRELSWLSLFENSPSFI